jgi:hypothetical protein
MSISINHDRVLEEKYHVCFQLDDYVDDHNHNCAVLCPSLLKMNANDDRHLHAGANHRKNIEIEIEMMMMMMTTTTTIMSTNLYDSFSMFFMTCNLIGLIIVKMTFVLVAIIIMTVIMRTDRDD